MSGVLTAQGLINCSASQSNYETNIIRLLQLHCFFQTIALRQIKSDVYFFKTSSQMKLLTFFSARGLLNS